MRGGCVPLPAVLGDDCCAALQATAALPELCGVLSARRVAVGLDVAGRVGAQRRERQEAAPTVCTLLRTTPAAADGAGRVGPGGEPAAGRFDHRAALAQQPGPRPQEPRRLPTPAPEQGDE